MMKYACAVLVAMHVLACTEPEQAQGDLPYPWRIRLRTPNETPPPLEAFNSSELRVVIRRAFGLPRHVRECAAETGVLAE